MNSAGTTRMNIGIVLPDTVVSTGRRKGRGRGGCFREQEQRKQDMRLTSLVVPTFGTQQFRNGT